MPQINGTLSTPRLDLGQAFYELMLNPNMYMGVQALPIFGTPLQSAAFSKVTRRSIARRRKVQRARGGRYNRDDWELKPDTFATVEYGHEQPLDDSDVALYASEVDAEAASAGIAMEVVLREQEIRIKDLLFNTTTWTGASLYTDNSANPWSNAATDVVAQVMAGHEKVRTLVGMRPNALIIGPGTVSNLLKNADIKARLSGVEVVTFETIQRYLAPIFGVSKIISSDAVVNTASEAKAEVMSDIWPTTYAMLACVAKTNNLQEPCLGRTFLWTADSPNNTTVEEYREEQVRGRVYRVRQNVQEKVFDASFAHLMKIG